MEKTVFSKSIANKIARTSFYYVIDCIRGVSDSGYDLSTDSTEFEQNFEEDLQELGIRPTEGRIKACRLSFERMIRRIDAKLAKS